MKHYLYKTTNLINNKYYIGRHSTSNDKDNYKGSGVALKEAILKYGIENFVVEILQYFTTYEELIEAEKIAVEKAVQDENSYNIGVGGYGGSLKEQWTLERKKRHRHKMKLINNTPCKIEKTRKSVTELHKQKKYDYWSKEGIETKRQIMTGNTYKLGKKETDETKRKKSAAHLGKKIGPLPKGTKMKISSSRKGKGMGERNAMASAEAREKVAASKRGRKKVWRDDGTFFWQKPGEK